MAEEQENQNPIERRDTGGGIDRRSDIARRGMNAANYVSGLAARQGADLQQTPIPIEYTYGFVRKWGEYGEGDGQFDHPSIVALDIDGNVNVMDTYDYRIQAFDSHIKSRTCAICAEPDIHGIDQALAAGTPYRAVAERLEIHPRLFTVSSRGRLAATLLKARRITLGAVVSSIREIYDRRCNHAIWR